ncbi:MAG TPA: SUF system Fe-S cluster assembly protein [bacterium]|nr:SUF system Fe-S cluster assembly protein [bacterium]HQG44363.1 SUF system Fe-S cluster assembly protein [bacterium]HQI47141.1 SUF system Fe-S cluster assembly protein [bacterium]HQJ63141.1 SUF system Fe-S cluster assembly protein [bacterium]
MANALDREALMDQVVLTLRDLYDPEIPVNIYDLGLIYHVDIDEEGRVDILMTLTSPMCPVAESLPPEIESRLSAIPGVSAVRVTVTWEPPWDDSRMSEEARLELGLF